MTNWYGSLIGTDGDNDIALPTTTKISPAGVAHGRLRYKRIYFKGMPLVTTPDIIRLGTFKSGDRIIEMLMTCDAVPGAGAFDLGLYEAGVNHDGAVVDDNLFCDAQIVSSAITRVDKLKEAGTLGDVDRGKTLWEMAAIGGGSYTEDPLIEFDLTQVVTTSYTTGDSTQLWEIYYTSGD